MVCESLHSSYVRLVACAYRGTPSVNNAIKAKGWKSCRPTIDKKFAALNSQSELFSLATDWSSGLSVDEVKKGMSSEKKKRLFPQIMSEYLAVHPKAESVPFTWIKSHLAEKYQIECRSISNFFVGILDEYELVGDNRNRL